MTGNSLCAVLDAVQTLPPLPSTMQRLASVVSDPDCSFDQIVEVIRYDQTITAELLRLCNSASIALTRRLSSVEDAVRYLGTAKTLQLVFAAHCQAMMSRPQAGYGLPSGALWTHSVAVALGCELLADRLKVDERGAVFTAGLLHDVGKLLLNEYVAAEYAEIAQRVSTKQASFVEAEQEVFGFNHATIGATVVERWGLPAPIIRCIRYHYTPHELSEPDPLVDVVHLADSVCILMGIGGGEDGLLYRADPAVAERHALTESDFEAIGSEIVCELKAVQSRFGAA